MKKPHVHVIAFDDTTGYISMSLAFGCSFVAFPADGLFWNQDKC